MAGIDKIYGNYNDWSDLFYWLANSSRPQYCKYFYPTPSNLDDPIACFPFKADKWIFANCPEHLAWVRIKILEQYGGNPPGTPPIISIASEGPIEEET
jgi:hypothetical protein